MSARLPWDDLQIFLATARGGTLAAAAGALGMNASTVHRRIARLEANLRTRLFERSQRGYALTVAGEELLEHARAMEEEVLRAGRKIGGMDQRLAGTIRVATVDDLAISLLSPLVRAFLEQHPGITVEVAVQSDFADLTRHQADVAIRFGARPGDSDVVAKHIVRVEVALYGSPAYLEARGRPRALADLADHDIVRGDARMAGVPMERVLAKIGGRTAYRSNSMLARLAAVRDGVGLGFLGCFMAEREPELERIDLELPDLSSDLWMLVHVDLRRNARVRAFVDFVHEGLVAERARFEGPAVSYPSSAGSSAAPR